MGKLLENSAVPCKKLKDLKQACITYGPTAPFNLAMLERFQSEALTPCLSVIGNRMLGFVYQGEIIYCGRVSGSISVNSKQGVMLPIIFL